MTLPQIAGYTLVNDPYARNLEVYPEGHEPEPYEYHRKTVTPTVAGRLTVDGDKFVLEMGGRAPREFTHAEIVALCVVNCCEYDDGEDGVSPDTLARLGVDLATVEHLVFCRLVSTTEPLRYHGDTQVCRVVTPAWEQIMGLFGRC